MLYSRCNLHCLELSWEGPNNSESIVVVQSLSHVWPFVTQWTAAHQASLSITNSGSLLKLMSITSFSSHLQSFPASGSFLMSWLFASGGQSIGASAWASVLPMNIQDWLPLGLTGLISLLSKGLSRVFPSTTVQKHQFFGAQLMVQLSHPYISTRRTRDTCLEAKSNNKIFFSPCSQWSVVHVFDQSLSAIGMSYLTLGLGK